jgi:ketosteroid isomerase-like protein
VKKKNLMSCLLGSMLVASAVWAQANMNGGIEQSVAALEQKWLQPYKTNNIDLVAPLLADNIVETDNGKVYAGKAAVLAQQKSYKWSSAEYNDVKVTVFGDTAIVTGGFKGKGTDAAGKPVDVQVRWTDTWVKMPNGQWQCVATQD